ncbi:MAG: hypothetical protein H6835_01570 [Planctomycetes bacterium]|nr:hypothetical protein [Planctomycetota bacterium]
MRRPAALVLLAGLVGCAAPPTPSGFAALVGEFAGDLRMGPDLGRAVPMQLLIAPCEGQPGVDADRYRFRLCYGEGHDRDERDYVLVVDDRASGRCHVDEGDGIELLGRLIEGELVTVFRVGDNVLDARYRAVARGIEFSLVSYDPAAGEVTGAGLEGPPLRTFGRVAHQRASLRRR